MDNISPHLSTSALYPYSYFIIIHVLQCVLFDFISLLQYDHGANLVRVLLQGGTNCVLVTFNKYVYVHWDHFSMGFYGSWFFMVHLT